MYTNIARRFSGFLPVVVDCETGGVDSEKDALLEVCAVVLGYDDQGLLCKQEMFHYHIKPFDGAVISERSLEVTQIKPDHPFRFAVTEKEMVSDLTQKLQKRCLLQRARKAVLVGHNAAFDLGFIKAAYERENALKSFPFHRFVSLDTATLTTIWAQESVLARAMYRLKVPFDVDDAHSALYDAEKTAEMFCKIINQIDKLKKTR